MFTDEQAQRIQDSFLSICTPCYGGQITEKHYVSMISYTIACMKNNMKFSIETMANESLVTRARNNLVAKTMLNPKATHLMFVDADVGFDAESIYKLIAHDKDVVGGIYPKKTFEPEYVFNPTKGAERNGSLLEVDDIGTGFLLIKRSVFDTMMSKFPNLKYNNSLNLEPESEKFMYALFDTSIDKAGNYLSEDYTFCERWRNLGGKIYADTSIQLTHTGYYPFTGDITLLQNN
ncbi:MAG: hypothetical protein CMA64_09085 [Euryarchaeota archaeon]|jgi:hypothetical protein|nr:hypothetical protein [Euryarchaeota archaeon]